MGAKEDILKVLSNEEKKISTEDLAEKLSMTEGSLRSLLSKLKAKKYADGSSKDGWIITPAGRDSADRDEKLPIGPDEVGADTESKLKYYGQLATVDGDKILACCELIMTGDPEDLNLMWDAMTKMDVPIMARRHWWHLWRNHLKKGVPPDLKDAVYGSPDSPGEGPPGSESEDDAAKEYVIQGDMPVRIGPGLGDFSLRDAEKFLTIRALSHRLGTPVETGDGVSPAGGSQSGGAEKLSDLITALAPYLAKGSDTDSLREILADKLALQKQEILSQIPPQQQPVKAKSTLENITEIVAVMTSLKEAGPLIRSILGMPETPSQPASQGGLARVDGPDGVSRIMELGDVIEWNAFINKEKRENEKHGALIRLGETVRENIPDGISAILGAVNEVKANSGTKNSQDEKVEEQAEPQKFRCGDCQTEFQGPANWKDEALKCPNPECNHVYSKEDLSA